MLPRVPFASCLECWGSTGEIDDYFSASLGRRTSGLHRTRMASFPPYLMVQLKRSVLPHCTRTVSYRDEPCLLLLQQLQRQQIE